MRKLVSITTLVALATGLLVLSSNGALADDPQQAERQSGVAGMEVIQTADGGIKIIDTQMVPYGKGEIAEGSSAVTDYDGDGCPDLAEINVDPVKGGKRDPKNPYDYMEATQNGQNRINDIIAVVNEYFIDDPVGFIDYGSRTDRTAIPGGNAWNLGPPNGQQRTDDMLAQVKQYFHDCSMNNVVIPDSVQFATGATTADQIEQLFTVDLAPFLVSLAAAGEGGVSGIVAGQEVSGFQVTCTYEDGGFVATSLVPSEPTVIPVQETGSDLYEEDVESAPACTSSVAGFDADDCQAWSSLYRPSGGIASIVVPSPGGYGYDAKTKCGDNASVISVLSVLIRIQYETPFIEGIVDHDTDWLDDDAEVSGNGLALNRSGACYVLISAHGAFSIGFSGREEYIDASFSPVRCVS